METGSDRADPLDQALDGDQRHARRRRRARRQGDGIRGIVGHRSGAGTHNLVEETHTVRALPAQAKNRSRDALDDCRVRARDITVGIRHRRETMQQRGKAGRSRGNGLRGHHITPIPLSSPSVGTRTPTGASPSARGIAASAYHWRSCTPSGTMPSRRSAPFMAREKTGAATRPP